MSAHPVFAWQNLCVCTFKWLAIALTILHLALKNSRPPISSRWSDRGAHNGWLWTRYMPTLWHFILWLETPINPAFYYYGWDRSGVRFSTLPVVGTWVSSFVWTRNHHKGFVQSIKYKLADRIDPWGQRLLHTGFISTEYQIFVVWRTICAL
jgi:hypothetical protein